MKRLFAVCLGVSLLARIGSAVVIPVNCNIFFNDSKAVQIAWNGYPGKSYVVQTTTDLAQPWQNALTTPATLTTTNNWLSYTFPVTGKAQFFKVVKLDSDGPEVYKTSPFDGAIGVGLQATLQAWLRDDSGVNTNTIALTVGTNAPISLSNPRLSYLNGVLTYTPGTNQFLGTNGQIVAVKLSAADTLGNQTTNFNWSFQLALSPVLSTNIVFLGGAGPAPCNLTLLSTNGNYFTFSYAGSCCLSNGMHLINTNLHTGYARTVVSFTNYPASNTVVALTRTATLAELLQAGTLSSTALISLTNSAGGKYQSKDLTPTLDFPLDYTVPLGHVLYQDANLVVELLPSSQLNLNATLHLAANFQRFKLTAVQAQMTGTASFELDAHAQASAARNFAGSMPLITPIHQVYGGYIGVPPFVVPVWVDVMFEVNAGYTANFSASAEITDGINAVKTISVGRKWDATSGWADIFDNPPPSLNILAPEWQVEGSAEVRAYLQPKVSVLIYSAAGFSADLQPYLDLTGSAQLNPPGCDLSLYAGLETTIGMNLRVWDESWGALPSTTLNLIPQQTLWHYSCTSNAPQITVQPQSQTAFVGSVVSFSVQAKGAAPLSYCWYKNGLYLTDDTRITGSGAGTLCLANVSSSDAGNYTGRVSNQSGSTNSAIAVLTVLAPPPPSPSPRMVWIAPGTFVMGSPISEAQRYSDETQHTVTLTKGFYMGKYAVTQGEYLALMGNNPSYFTTRDYNGNSILPDLSRPVEQVSWNDATAYCAQLTAQEQAAGRLPAGWVYRLPTESEREYACRAGTTTAFNFGSGIHGGMANFSDWHEYDASIGDIYFSNPAVPWLVRTTSVGSYQPNAWGLHDMHGNVWEWCQDWYGSYPTGSVIDPQGPNSGSDRVIRGGSWGNDGRDCRSADRGYDSASARSRNIGFRVVLAPGQP